MKKAIKIKKEDFKDLKLKIEVEPLYPIKECDCIRCEMNKYKS